MAISFINLGASSNLGSNNSTNPDINNNGDASSFANSSWSPPTSGIIICVVSHRLNSATPAIPTISGNSLTWVEIKTLAFGARRITILAALATGATTGATTVAFGGETQQHCTASFFQVTGVDTSSGIAAVFVQTPTNNGTDVGGSITLASASSSNNRPIACFYQNANEVHAPRTNWTELDDMRGSAGVHAMDTQYRGDTFETTASATWTTSSIWGGIAAELKATSTATLAASAGSFIETGITSSLLFGHKISVIAGSFVDTGISSGLIKKLVLVAGSGIYSETGIISTLLLSRLLASDTSIFSISGNSIGLLNDRRMVSNSGDLLLIGSNSILLTGRRLISSSGVYYLDGILNNFVFNHSLSANQGLYNYTGNNTSINYGYVIVSSLGTFTLSGDDSNFIHNYVLGTTAQNYNFSGNLLSILYGKILSADIGNISLVGLSNNLRLGKFISADVGIISETGNNILFILQRYLLANIGQFIINSISIGFDKSHPIISIDPSRTYRITIRRESSLSGNRSRNSRVIIYSRSRRVS